MPARRSPHLVFVLIGWTLAVAAGAQPPPVPLAEQPPVRWEHRLAWSVSSEEILFGQIAEVVRLGGGTTAIADRQLGQVLLIDGQGSVVRALEVQGEGPGRVAQLAGLCALPDERLLLVQAWPGRGEVVTLDGVPVRSLVAGGRDEGGGHDEGAGLLSLLRVTAAHGLFVGVLADVQFLDHERSRNVLRLCRLDEDLRPRGDLLRREATMLDRMGVVDETAMDFPIRAWCIVDGRQVAVAPARTDYRLEVHDIKGGPPQIYVRDLPALPRPRAEVERLRAAYGLEVDGERRAIDFRYFPTAEMIQEIVPLGDGRLLLDTAYRAEALPPATTARLDLVDLAAATVTEVRLSVPLRHDRDRLVVLPDGDLVVLREDHAFAAAAGAADAPAIEYWRTTERRR